MASSLVVALRNKLLFMEQSFKQKLDEAVCMEKQAKEASMKAEEVSSRTCSSNYHLYILTKITTVFLF